MVPFQTSARVRAAVSLLLVSYCPTAAHQSGEGHDTASIWVNPRVWGGVGIGSRVQRDPFQLSPKSAERPPRPSVSPAASQERAVAHATASRLALDGPGTRRTCQAWPFHIATAPLGGRSWPEATQKCAEAHETEPTPFSRGTPGPATQDVPFQIATWSKALTERQKPTAGQDTESGMTAATGRD